MDTLTPTKRRHDGSVVGGVQLFAPAPALLAEQLASASPSFGEAVTCFEFGAAAYSAGRRRAASSGSTPRPRAGGASAATRSPTPSRRSRLPRRPGQRASSPGRSALRRWGRSPRKVGLVASPDEARAASVADDDADRGVGAMCVRALDDGSEELVVFAAAASSSAGPSATIWRTRVAAIHEARADAAGASARSSARPAPAGRRRPGRPAAPRRARFTVARGVGGAAARTASSRWSGRPCPAPRSRRRATRGASPAPRGAAPWTRRSSASCPSARRAAVTLDVDLDGADVHGWVAWPANLRAAPLRIVARPSRAALGDVALGAAARRRPQAGLCAAAVDASASVLAEAPACGFHDDDDGDDVASTLVLRHVEQRKATHAKLILALADAGKCLDAAAVDALADGAAFAEAAVAAARLHARMLQTPDMAAAGDLVSKACGGVAPAATTPRRRAGLSVLDAFYGAAPAESLAGLIGALGAARTLEDGAAKARVVTALCAAADATTRDRVAKQPHMSKAQVANVWVADASPALAAAEATGESALVVDVCLRADDVAHLGAEAVESRFADVAELGRLCPGPYSAILAEFKTKTGQPHALEWIKLVEDEDFSAASDSLQALTVGSDNAPSNKTLSLIAVLLKNKQAVYVAHQSGLDITKHYDDVTGLALKALAEGLGDADELLDAFFTALHLDAPEEEAETRPAPLASLPDAKRLATFLVNAAKVAADMQRPRYDDLLRRKAIVHPAYVVPPYAPHYVPPPPTTPPPLFETGLKPEV
ncbi:hypothetical protein JL720_405 [Aureococcus anophagefferens]|nr:hypothetical protein JL720_405 [Aureococcus anophagefferens]